jgi:hypothetical protein
VHLTPYLTVDDIGFDLTPDALVARLGRPASITTNDVALTAYDYGERVFRFQDNGRLEEVTQRVPVLRVGSVAIPFAALAGFVRAQDDDAFDRAGFLVSPRWGIAFVPDEPDWLTALARHCIPTWQALPGDAAR